MAKVQYGAFITELKGSVGGSTFQSSRHGFTVRNKPISPKSRSTIQSTIRNWWRVISQHWRTLTDGERTAWGAVAPNWPAVDSYGNPITLTGFEVFMKASFGLVSVGQSIVDAASNPAVLYDPAYTSIDLLYGAGTMTLTWTNSPIPAGSVIVIAASPPMSAGSKPRYSNIRSFTLIGNPTVSPYDFSAEYVKRYGAFPAAGQRISFELYVVDTTNGTTSSAFSVSELIQP